MDGWMDGWNSGYRVSTALRIVYWPSLSLLGSSFGLGTVGYYLAGTNSYISNTSPKYVFIKSNHLLMNISPGYIPDQRQAFSNSTKLFDMQLKSNGLVFIGPNSDHMLASSLTNSLVLLSLYWIDPGWGWRQLNSWWWWWMLFCDIAEDVGDWWPTAAISELSSVSKIFS